MTTLHDQIKLPPHVISSDHPNSPGESWSIPEMDWIRLRDQAFHDYVRHAAAELAIASDERIEALEAALSESRKDSERYRWLRDTNLDRPDMTDGSRVILAPNEVTSIWYGLPEDKWDLMGGCLACSKGDKFDNAIDAAIMKGQP